MLKSMVTRQMIGRMVRAAKLDKSLFAEVKTDTTLTGEAFGVVLVTGLFAGLGYALQRGASGDVFWGFVLGMIFLIVGYFIWVWLTRFIGTELFGGKADYGELRRTLGYAYAPNSLAVLAFLPGIGGLIVLLASIWALTAGVIAAREVLNFTTLRAILTVLFGWVVVLLFVGVLGAAIAAVMFTV